MVYSDRCPNQRHDFSLGRLHPESGNVDFEDRVQNYHVCLIKGSAIAYMLTLAMESSDPPHKRDVQARSFQVIGV